MSDLASALTLRVQAVDATRARREQQELIEKSRLREDALPSRSRAHHRWCAVYEGQVLQAGFIISVHRSRRVPWAKLVRWEGLGRDAFEVLESRLPRILPALRAVVPHVLRVNVVLREFDPARRDVLRDMLATSGYVAVAARDYIDTLLLPLDQDAEPSQHFSSSTRRNLREAQRAGITVRRVTQATDLAQVRDVVAEAFARRGADVVIPDAEDLQADLTVEHVALFAAALPGQDRIVACARFRRVGDLAMYEIAGSRRDPALGRLPVAPLLLAEGIEWARRNGCRWMDFGGVPLEDGTALAGIAAFKAGFGGTRVSIGGEWRLRPSPRLARLEDLLSGTR